MPGIELTPTTLSDFMAYLTASPQSHAINFREFRDFLLLLPRKVNTKEIFQYYQVRKFLGDDGRGPARVTMEGACFCMCVCVCYARFGSNENICTGDVTLSAEDKPPKSGNISATAGTQGDAKLGPSGSQRRNEKKGQGEHEEDEHEEKHVLEGHSALRYLLAGGIAGAGQ
jgi:solute carrier family 25 (mitochondrial phosphate transporter), member 23/24/25/41